MAARSKGWCVLVLKLWCESSWVFNLWCKICSICVRLRDIRNRVFQKYINLWSFASMSISKPSKRRGYRPSVLIVTLESHPTPSKIAQFILIYSLSELGTITELNCVGLFCLLSAYL